jgi:hypothetical protein
MTESHESPETGSKPQRTGEPSTEKKAQREKVQKQLDDALADSFPASDPVSIVTSHDEEDWGDSKPTSDKPSSDKPSPEKRANPRR